MWNLESSLRLCMEFSTQGWNLLPEVNSIVLIRQGRTNVKSGKLTYFQDGCQWATAKAYTNKSHYIICTIRMLLVVNSIVWYIQALSHPEIYRELSTQGACLYSWPEWVALLVMRALLLPERLKIQYHLVPSEPLMQRVCYVRSFNWQPSEVMYSQVVRWM